MKKQLLLTTALTLGLAVPVLAEPTIGLGVSMTFGSGRHQTGVGLRFMSDNEAESIVGTVGIDYMLQSKNLRPTVGLAYLSEKVYFGLDIGYDFNGSAYDIGVGVGGLNTMETVVKPAPEATTTEPVITTTSAPTTSPAPTTTPL